MGGGGGGRMEVGEKQSCGKGIKKGGQNNPNDSEVIGCLDAKSLLREGTTWKTLCELPLVSGDTRQVLFQAAPSFR